MTADRLTWGSLPEGDPPPEGEPLPKRWWPVVGIFPGPDGEPTHALGDAHAEKIVSGEIPYEEARKAQRRVDKQVDAERRREMFHRNRRRFE